MASNSSTSTTLSTSDPKDSRWYFTAEQLGHSPSRRQGINAEQELSYRQQTAYLIQEMGQRLSVSQLCINTAIVYMHRFYAFHSFTHFHRNGIAAAALFLAAKVEEQPRKLEHVIKVSHLCLNTEFPSATTDLYNEQAQDLVFNENVLLQTLGFDVAIDHPHTHVVKTCHLVKACKDLAQTSYFLASNSLHLTSMCLQYRPTVVACFCIYLACKWSRWEIPQSTEGKHWFHYVDTSVTLDLLKQLTDEFLAIYEKSPARLKAKLNSIKALAQSARMNEPSRMPDANGSSSQQQLIPENVRRPEHSSHHKHHSSSATSHHSHHSKQSLPPIEAGEHGKIPSSHKQQSYSGSHSSSSRPRPDRAQVSAEGQVHPAHGSNKQSVPPGAQRSSTSSRPPHGIVVPGPTASHRVPHSVHDPNYHKSRSAIPPQLNPAIGGHKPISKTSDTQRNVMKETSGRPIDPNKLPIKHSNNSGSNSNANSGNMYPGSSIGSTTGVDMTRNVLQMQGSVGMQQQAPQRNYNQPNITQPPNFNQPIPSRNSNSNTAKYDQSVQQQLHMQSGQKQSLESSFSTTNSRQMDESNVKVEQMEICSPTKYGYQQQPPTQLPQQVPPQLVTSKPSSIFSPDWNDKASHPAIHGSIKASGDSAMDRSIGQIAVKSNRDSPKRLDRDRRSVTPKKERIRTEQQSQDASKLLQQSEKRKKLLDPPSQPLVQNAPSNIPSQQYDKGQALNLSSVKRLNENSARPDDERDFKIRKIEPLSPSKMVEIRAYPYEQSGIDSRSVKTFSSTVNGIETDPDLVRNLLKESLCTDNKLLSIKPEPLLEYADIKPIDPIGDIETLPAQLLQSESPIKEIKPEAVDSVGGGTSDQYSKTKSEKKKKKDKHKHKEKDKTKDKDERKKHKKDKDKSKERDRSSGNELEQNHVKLTIPKEKLNLQSLAPPAAIPPTSELKIKIPKDRIRAELSHFQIDDSSANVNTNDASLPPPPPPSSLKIKISKDKIESYSHSQHSSTSSSVGGSSSYHSHSSKKKDRDRDKDRDKDKKRSSSSGSNDHNKQNGSGSNSGSGGSLSESSTTKSQASNSNKMQQYSSNMSQLFGDINDYDSPSPPSPLIHSSHHYHQQQQQQQQQQHQQRYSHSDKYSSQYHQQQQQMGGNYYSSK